MNGGCRQLQNLLRDGVSSQSPPASREPIMESNISTVDVDDRLSINVSKPISNARAVQTRCRCAKFG
jgi:hypothetical protein